MPAPLIESKNRRTNFADSGFTSNISRSAGQAWYNSPTETLARASSLWASGNQFNAMMGFPLDRELTPQEALDEYGVTMSGNRTEEQVQELSRNQRANSYRDEKLQATNTGAIRKVTGIGAQLIAGIVDPINLATMGIGLTKNAAKGVALAVGGGKKGALVSGAIDASIGVAAVEPFHASAHIYNQEEYNWKDAAMAFGMSAAFGASIKTAMHAFGDLRRSGAIDDVDIEDAISVASGQKFDDAPINASVEAMRFAAKKNDEFNVQVDDEIARLSQDLEEWNANTTTEDPLRVESILRELEAKLEATGKSQTGKRSAIAEEIAGRREEIAELNEGLRIKDELEDWKKLKETENVKAQRQVDQDKADLKEIRKAEITKQKARNEGVPEPEKPREALQNDQGDEVHIRELEEEIARHEKAAQQGEEVVTKIAEIENANMRLRQMAAFEKNKESFTECLIKSI